MIWGSFEAFQFSFNTISFGGGLSLTPSTKGRSGSDPEPSASDCLCSNSTSLTCFRTRFLQPFPSSQNASPLCPSTARFLLRIHFTGCFSPVSWIVLWGWASKTHVPSGRFSSGALSNPVDFNTTSESQILLFRLREMSSCLLDNTTRMSIST